MQLVVIEWRDIIAFSGWEKAADAKCPTIHTVGWLVSRNQDTVMIANTLDYEDFAGDGKDDLPIPYGITAFPTGCVLSVKNIDSGECPI